MWILIDLFTFFIYSSVLPIFVHKKTFILKGRVAMATKCRWDDMIFVCGANLFPVGVEIKEKNSNAPP